MTYPMPENITRVEDLVPYVNSITNNYFSLSLLLMIWVVSFAGFKMYKSPEAFAGASFITAVASVLMFYAEWISGTYLAGTVLMLVISVIFLGKQQ